MVKTLATKVIASEEGFSETVYHCTEGYPTVGYGIKIGYKGQDLNEYREFPKLPKTVASVWLSCEIDTVIKKIEADEELSFYHNLNDVRKVVVISMCYQIGTSGFKKFKNAIKAMEEGDFNKAADEMADSLWHKQTTLRANRHSRMMSSGVILPYYE